MILYGTSVALSDPDITYKLEIKYSKEHHIWEFQGYTVQHIEDVNHKIVDGGRVQFTNFQEMLDWLGRNCKW